MKSLLNLLQVFIVPAIVLQPMYAVAPRLTHGKAASLPTHAPLAPSYDAILQLINALENSDLEATASSEELMKINHFLALVAREGYNDDPFELEEDIQELLETDSFCYSTAQNPTLSKDFVFSFATGELVFCKSWLSKRLCST